MEDPYDADWMKSVISNPFAEAKQALTESPEPTFKSAFNRGGLSPDIASALGNMARTWQTERAQAGGTVLVEGRDVQDEIDGTNDTVDVDLVESGSLPGEQLNENGVLIIDDGDDE